MWEIVNGMPRPALPAWRDFNAVILYIECMAATDGIAGDLWTHFDPIAVGK